VPYRFGPFSFALYQEAGKLEAESYVCTDGENGWALGRSLEIPKPPAQISRDCRAIVERFCDYPLDSLVEHVYRAFPAYTFNSDRLRLTKRPIAPPAVYTAGYESLSVDAFLNLLAQEGIQRLIDVRRNPVARRYGFHKTTLSRLAGGLGIDYVHLPDLGISSEERRHLQSDEDYSRLFRRYEADTLSMQTEAIARTCRLVDQVPSVLVCMEGDPAYCHRRVLAEKISLKVGLPVRHLLAVS
jgi:uncharacterized protein (DUF488 family)